MSSLTKSVAFLVLLSLLVSMAAEAAMTCSQATTNLAPCVSYLTNNSPTSSTNCCEGVRSIVASVTTPADRRATCECLKNTASNMQNINVDRAAALPGQCGVDLHFRISSDIDCSRVSV